MKLVAARSIATMAGILPAAFLTAAKTSHTQATPRRAAPALPCQTPGPIKKNTAVK